MSTAKVSAPSSSPELLYLQTSRGVRTSAENLVFSPTSSGYSSSRDSEQPPLQEKDFQRTKRRRRDKADAASVPKICAVCGDQAKNTHFGGVCCDSCKAFFRRSVQSNSYKRFQCHAKEVCPIIKNKRRLCQYCR